jgi:DnaK suppressor protein
MERILVSKLRELDTRGLREGIAVHRAPDEMDEVQQAAERELALLTVERQASLSQQIRLALLRLERGEYGKCVACGDRIGSRRLKAVPWAGMCLTCQESIELEADRRPSHGREDC